VPVIGNGDITSPEDVRSRMATGVRGIMIGRAACAAPVDFRENQTLPKDGRNLAPPVVTEQWSHILRHCRLEVQRQGSELHAMQSMRTQLMHYSRGMPEAKRLRDRLPGWLRCCELEDIAREHLECGNRPRA
jgi:tRNA-dihydrouridine synthase